MGVMTVLPRGRAFTREDLDALPDDGWRHELIDGALVMTPGPSWSHQLAVGELYLLLRRHCPPGLTVLFAPFDVALAIDTVMQPDLLVARRTDFTHRDLPVAPLLAVEVLSPSTRRIDLTLKRDRFETAGCASYWVVDPLAPSIVAWDLVDGAYAEAGRAEGDQPCHLTAPYDVTVVPSEIADL